MAILRGRERALMWRQITPEGGGGGQSVRREIPIEVLIFLVFIIHRAICPRGVRSTGLVPACALEVLGIILNDLCFFLTDRKRKIILKACFAALPV